MTHTRRRFLATLSIVGTAGVFGSRSAHAAEGDLETRSVRIFANRPGICVAPQYIAEPLLHAEGFTEVRFVGLTAATGLPAAQAVGSGDADFTVTFAAPLAIAIDGGAPITLLVRGACRLLRIVRK
jgi:NitT/TauT family transport system substrate-binding protein